MSKLASCVLLLSALASAADLTGTWQFEQAGRGGRGGQPGPPIVNTFIFKVDGTKFTGSWITPQQVLDIVNGSQKGGEIAFQTSDDHSTTAPRIANYTGTLEGDQLTLTAVMNQPGGRGPQTFATAQATRVTSPEQAALDEAIAAAAQAGRGGRGGGGRGGAPAPMVLKKMSSDTVFKAANPHAPFPAFKPIPPNGLAKTPPMG